MQLYLKGFCELYGIRDLLRQFFGQVHCREEKAYICLEVEAFPELCWLAWGKKEGEYPSSRFQRQDDQEAFVLYRIPKEDFNSDERLKNLGDEELQEYLQNAGKRILGTRDSRNCLKNWDPSLNLYQEKRDAKRIFYFALLDLTQKAFPWGALTGIRPTLLAHELQDFSREESEGLLVHYYGLLPEKANLLLETAEEERRLLARLPSDTCAAYLHVPYCPSRCSYCSFSTPEGIGRKEEDLDLYLDALEEEMRTVYEGGLRPALLSFYVGGGTPGVLRARHIIRLGKMMQHYLCLQPGAELTFEAGRPDTLEREQLLALREIGFERLCVNPQTFHQKTLDLVQRKHSVEQIFSAYDLALSCGFEKINMDLILGLPGETEADMMKSLEILEQIHPASFTVHSLAIKRASALKKTYILEPTALRLHQRDEVLERVQKAAEHCARNMGLKPYYMYRQKEGVGGLENLGYARPGEGCLYNLAMMGDGLSVLSFGAGGMSKRVEGTRIERSANLKNPLLYQKQAQEMGQRKLDLWSQAL